jgi:signal transduction histidine kinase
LIQAFNRMQSRIAELVRNRSFMLGAISHDLRTYLTRLRLRIELMPDADARERATRDVEGMQNLVEDALMFARGTFGADEQRPVDLGALVRRECAERDGGKVRLSAPAEPVTVTGDAAALARVVGNLVDNALKYGEAAEVSAARCGDLAEIIIDDHGPGIPAGERERIFEPFRRLEESRNRERGGAGLGLAIARQVIESHRGTIRVEDRPGGGARFRVQLPLATVVSA